MKTEDHIIDLLKDDSFPPMLMLDGGWGSGKTYFVKNTLMERLKKRFPDSKVDYLSLYGLENINDFRDRIISFLLTKSENSSSLTSEITNAIDGAGKFFGEKGIGSILNGVSGAIKHGVLSSVKNRIFILDDLERVSNEALINGILGEAFNFVEQHINIKVLVVANSEKILCKDSLEKVFVDKVPFVLLYDDILDVVKPQFLGVLDDGLVELLKATIKDLELKNIRVLKRALTKFQRLVSDINDESVITDIAYPILLEQIIRVCHANLSEGYSEEEINDFDEYRHIRHMSEESKVDRKEALCEILTTIKRYSNKIEKLLVRYCCTGKHEFANIAEDLNLPKRNDLLSSMISVGLQCRLTEEEFVEGTKVLKNYIDSDEKLNIYKWIRACDTYIYMIDHKIIENNGLGREQLLDIMSGKNPLSFEMLDITQKDEFELGLDFKSEDVRKIYENLLEEIFTHKESDKISDLKDRFSQSWTSVHMEIYSDWKAKPLLNILGDECILEAFKDWSEYDLYYFVSGIQERYKHRNIWDHYLDESETISKLVLGLPNLISEFQYSRKCAILFELKVKLEDIKKRLESPIDN